jgi:DNA helicase-4
MSFRKVLIHIIRFLLLSLSIIGIWYLIREWLRKKPLKQRLLDIADQIREANSHFERLTNFGQYFANRDEQLFLNAYRETRKAIGSKFERIGLPVDHVEAIRRFRDNFDQSSTIRQDYNNQFVAREAEKFAGFFANLESYPLSDDQIEAIIRDEDNNLVIAGAGTGKTTTISGKVAYLLEKGIARPEELLIISFTKNAVREMYDRCTRFCQHIPEAKDLEVRTFNSFGFLVSRSCSAQEILLAFDGDDNAAKTFLQEQFDELFINDPDFQRKAINFLAFFNRPARNEFEFETKNDYLTYEQSFKNMTLDGVKVNSKEEVEIANFFCLFNVDYEYQRHFPLNEEDRNAGYGVYQPDFYLTDHQIWHEHFGIDRNGDVPYWFNTRPPYKTARDYYHAGITWKERIHAKYQTRLIKTYSYENREGNLIANLKKKLISEGVTLRQRSPQEMLELIRKSDQYQECMGLIYTFLGLMKSNGKTPADPIPAKDDKRLMVFMDIFKPLFSAYDSHLKNIPAVDYNDMINHAAQHFRNGKYTKPYKYILVDEFQDMSLGRYQLLKAIRQQNPDVKLYAVGDDWQSIFRFTGSDISIITRFKEQFGFTSQTAVLKTYRFNEQILHASSDFVQKNPSQIRKQLTAYQSTPEGHVSFEFVKMPPFSGNREQFLQLKSQHLLTVLEKIAALQADASVFLIGRYKLNVPRDISGLRRLFPKLTITFFTAHGVKGMTCDYAVLLDVDSGVLGFPSEIADDPLLSYLLHEGDGFENAEERRVFYVAITRARYKNYLIYNESQPSKFLLELQATTGISPEQAERTCPECHGPLIKRRGLYSEFYGCIHYPRCNGKMSVLTTTH